MKKSDKELLIQAQDTIKKHMEEFEVRFQALLAELSVYEIELIRKLVKPRKCPDTEESVKEKRAFVAAQAKEARETSFVTLRNGRKIPLWLAYRCLYCIEYYNQAGAEEHFGMTRGAYFARQDELVIHGEE